jgi:hypothetical protein
LISQWDYQLILRCLALKFIDDLIDSSVVNYRSCHRGSVLRTIQQGCLCTILVSAISGCRSADEKNQEVSILDAVKSIRSVRNTSRRENRDGTLLQQISTAATLQLKHLKGRVFDLRAHVTLTRAKEILSKLTEHVTVRIDSKGNWHVVQRTKLVDKTEGTEQRSRHCMEVDSQRFFSPDDTSWLRYEPAVIENASCLDTALSWIPNLLKITGPHLETSHGAHRLGTDWTVLQIRGAQIGALNAAIGKENIEQWNQPKYPYLSLIGDRGVLQRLRGRITTHTESGAVIEGNLEAEFEIQKLSPTDLSIRITLGQRPLAEFIETPQHTVTHPRHRVISDIGAITGLDPKKLGKTAPLPPRDKTPKIETKTRD